MVGEALHDQGKDGAIRAKKWLDGTTRVRASWLNTDPSAAQKLSFRWPSSNTLFSFDMGGILRGGEFENQMFMVECKKYTTTGNQGSMYREYLAKCYVATTLNSAITDHFMWITWHPFLVDSWRDLCKPEQIRKGLIEQKGRILGTSSTDQDIEKWVEDDVLTMVASKLWILVLSDRQEQLVITNEHRGLIVNHEIAKGGSW